MKNKDSSTEKKTSDSPITEKRQLIKNRKNKYSLHQNTIIEINRMKKI